MSRRRAIGALVTGLLSICQVSVAQEAAPLPTWNPVNSEEVSLSFGPQQDGGFGSNFKADTYASPDWARINDSLAAYLGLNADAQWSSAKDALNQSTLSMELGLWVMADNDAYALATPAVDLYLDLRQRYGQFKTDGSDVVENVNHTLFGVGLETPVPGGGALVRLLSKASGQIDEVPLLRITHYWNSDRSDQAQPLPEKLKADQLLLQLQGALSVPGLRYNQSSFEFQYELGFTKPTTGADKGWQSYSRLALVLEGDASLKPAIVYSHGEQDGLEYDERLLFGLLWSFAGGEDDKKAVIARSPQPAQVVPLATR